MAKKTDYTTWLLLAGGATAVYFGVRGLKPTPKLSEGGDTAEPLEPEGEGFEPPEPEPEEPEAEPFGFRTIPADCLVNMSDEDILVTLRTQNEASPWDGAAINERAFTLARAVLPGLCPDLPVPDDYAHSKNIDDEAFRDTWSRITALAWNLLMGKAG